MADAVDWISSRRFNRDIGVSDAESVCIPAQRQRIWPSDLNCWEATAHFAAEAIAILPDDYTIVIKDATRGRFRHVWPTIELPGILAPLDAQYANDVGRDIFGGIHVAGRIALDAFGLDRLGGILEDVNPYLPEWSRRNPKPNARPEEQRAQSEEKRAQKESASPTQAGGDSASDLDNPI